MPLQEPCLQRMSPRAAATEALATEAPATDQRNAYEDLIDLLTDAAKDFYHGVCDPAVVEAQVWKKMLDSQHLDRLEAMILDHGTVTKHIHLLKLITKQKSGNAKEFLFLEWCTKCIHVRNQVLASRPAAQLLHNTAASDHGCDGCDGGAMLTENETSRCYQLLH